MDSIWKENYRLMEEIKNCAISYTMFVDNGGYIGTYTDALLNKTIALLTKVKANRDYISEVMSYDIPSENQECDTAMDILDGVFKEDRVHSVIERIYAPRI